MCLQAQKGGENMEYILCFIISLITSAYISIQIGNIVGIKHLDALDKDWNKALENFMEEVRRIFDERRRKK